MNDTRDRILDVALELLGTDPGAGMGDIASAAGVVRRTVYGHFPSRADLVRTLTQQAADELTAVLTEVDDPSKAADEIWVAFIARLWPVAHRYRVLLVLRRSEYGDEIHTVLGMVQNRLAHLVARGQEDGTFGRHLPPDLLSEVAQASVFAIAAADVSRNTLGVRAATITSLLMLGVPESRAHSLLRLGP